MKKLVIAAFAVVAMASFSSCAAGDCVTCTNGGVEGTVCKDDFINAGGTEQGWADYKEAALASGCTE